MRYFAEIAYDGTDFSGWQVQPSKTTVQGEINRVLSQITQENIHVVGCGRTDAGVHASQFYLHFDTQKVVPDNIAYKLNSMLPENITVYRVFSVEADQHSRFDAARRSYVYHMHFEKNPFLTRFSSYSFYKNLDVVAMQQVAASLINYQDFDTVSKFNEDNQNTLCNIYESKLLVFENENRMELHISANRFLHNMIRRIMGLLISVGRGKISQKEVAEVFSNGGKFGLNFVAPPQGLFLCGVEYPFVNDRKEK